MATVHNRPTVFGEPMASRDMGIPELNIAYEDGEIARYDRDLRRRPLFGPDELLPQSHGPESSGHGHHTR